MSSPDITEDEVQAVVQLLRTSNLSLGPRLEKFEKLAAEAAGAKHAVGVVNGTAGLHLCMVAAGIGPGDEVITTPFSFVASANCILYERARPVFVDIDPLTLNIDPAKLQAAITPYTKAIIPVHVFGQPADMDPIVVMAEKHNLVVIEDACEAIGAEYKGRRVGALGKAGVFAFYPNKQMTTGEGALLLTNDDHWAELFRSLRNQGRDQFDEWLAHSRLGFNYRLDEMSAAMGVVQIGRLDGILEKRSAVAQEYTQRLGGIPGVCCPVIVPNTTRMSWFVFTIRLAPRIDRNRVMALLAEKGIPARPYFTPIHLQPFYQRQFGFRPGDFPEAEAAGQSILALPFHTNMATQDIDVVCEALAQVLPMAAREKREMRESKDQRK